MYFLPCFLMGIALALAFLLWKLQAYKSSIRPLMMGLRICRWS